MNEGLIQRIVEEVVRRLRALEGMAPQGTVDLPVRLVTEEGVAAVVAGGGASINVTPRAIVTPLAQDLLRQEKVRLVVVEGETLTQAVASKSPVVALGSDHRGFALKDILKKMLTDAGRDVIDCGAYGPRETSYVTVAKSVADAVVGQNLTAGIVVDGGGAPSAVVANKVLGIRAAACNDVTAAKFARAHIDANVLCLGAGAVGETVAKEIVATWLSTPFEGGSFATRVREIQGVEQDSD